MVGNRGAKRKKQTAAKDGEEAPSGRQEEPAERGARPRAPHRTRATGRGKGVSREAAVDLIGCNDRRSDLVTLDQVERIVYSALDLKLGLRPEVEQPLDCRIGRQLRWLGDVRATRPL
jgi:hypothetical protein